MPASAIIDAWRWLASMREMCRCVTWPISWLITVASSDSLPAAASRPVWMPMKPPGRAKALIDLSRTAKNSNWYDRAGPVDDQPGGEPVQELGHLGVVPDHAVRAQLAHDRLAQPAFGGAGKLVAARGAEVGQAIDLGPCPGRTGEQGDSRQQRDRVGDASADRAQAGRCRLPARAQPNLIGAIDHVAMIAMPSG